MKYVIKHEKTNEQEECEGQYDIQNILEYNDWNREDCMIYKMIGCRGCLEYVDDVQLRYDFHGIETGHYCGKCYNDDDKYRYRRDAYPTIETHGYGERLNDDY